MKKLKKNKKEISSSNRGDKRDAGPDRRNFLKKAVLFLFGAEAAYLLFDFFNGNKKENIEPEDLYEVGHTHDFEPGRIYPFTSGKFYIYKFDDGGMIAISYRCTHLGCTINYSADDKKFICPCHASAFNIKGEVLSPPATRPLDTLPVYIRNGIVKVDINHPKKRKRFERSQLVYG
jgi:nitrite reductase/ring-hydroxylating ferredoxin subunit